MEVLRAREVLLTVACHFGVLVSSGFQDVDES